MGSDEGWSEVSFYREDNSPLPSRVGLTGHPAATRLASRHQHGCGCCNEPMPFRKAVLLQNHGLWGLLSEPGTKAQLRGQDMRADNGARIPTGVGPSRPQIPPPIKGLLAPAGSWGRGCVKKKLSAGSAARPSWAARHLPPKAAQQ